MPPWGELLSVNTLPFGARQDKNGPLVLSTSDPDVNNAIRNADRKRASQRRVFSIGGRFQATARASEKAQLSKILRKREDVPNGKKRRIDKLVDSKNYLRVRNFRSSPI